VSRYENGIDERSGPEMLKPLFEILDKNMRKKVAKISDDQWIEVLEQSQEIYELNEEAVKKVNIRDIIRSKIQGLKIATKFADIDSEIDILVPKLTSVLMSIFTDTEFVQDLLLFNGKSQCKVQYQVDDLFTQLATFADKVVKNGQNGYQGYRFSAR